MVSIGTFYSKTVTAADDNPFTVDDEGRTKLSCCNIHCYTNDCYYGNMSAQAAIIRANAVVWFEGSPVRVSDLWFKNLTAGQNATLVITGILIQE
jgi:hypothetical protein